MAIGRRDYTWGVLQDAILPGRYSVNWFKTNTVIVGLGASETLITYTVPGEYKFFLTGVFVSCSSPHLNQLVIGKNDVAFITKFFSINTNLDLASLGSYIFAGDDVMKVLIFNNDDHDLAFYVQAFGVLEQLV